MFFKKLALFFTLIFFSFTAVAETEKSYVFQIPNSKSTLNNALGAIPLIGDITTSTDLDERVFVVRISNAKTTLFIDGTSIALGAPGNVYNFEYLNKDIVLDLAQMTLVSTSLLDENQKPKTYELDLLFGSADFENQIAGLEGEIAEKNSVIADQKTELANAQVSINTLSIVSDRVENLELILAEREGQLEAASDTMVKLNADIAALDAQLAEAESIISTQVKELSDAEKTSADLEATSSRLASLQENLKEKDDQITSAQASIDSLNKVIATLQGEFDEAGQMITLQADQLTFAEASIDRLENDIAMLEKQLDEANSVISTQLSDLDTAADKIADLQAQIENAQKENSETETTAPAATDASDTDDQQDSTAAPTATNDAGDDVTEKPVEDQGTAEVTAISFSQFSELKSHLTRYANFIGHLEGCAARPTFNADWQSLNKDKDKTLISADEMHALAISAMAELNVDFDTMDKLDNIMRESRNAKSRDISDKVNNSSASSYYETCMTVAIMADAVRDFDGVMPTDPIERMKVFAEFSPLR